MQISSILSKGAGALGVVLFLLACAASASAGKGFSGDDVYVWLRLEVPEKPIRESPAFIRVGMAYYSEEGARAAGFESERPVRFRDGVFLSGQGTGGWAAFPSDVRIVQSKLEVKYHKYEKPTLTVWPFLQSNDAYNPKTLPQRRMTFLSGERIEVPFALRRKEVAWARWTLRLDRAEPGLPEYGRLGRYEIVHDFDLDCYRVTAYYPDGAKRMVFGRSGAESHGKWARWAKDGSVIGAVWYLWHGKTVDEKEFERLSAEARKRIESQPAAK